MALTWPVESMILEHPGGTGIVMNKYRRFISGLFRHTPYEIRKRKPPITFSPVRLLLAYFCALDRETTLIQVGACDGSTDDPLFPFLRTGKLRAILLEPIPHSHQKLSSAYEGIPRITVLHAALAETDGEAVMFQIKPIGAWADSTWAPQVASFDKRHILRHGIPRGDIEELRVPSLSLAYLVKKYNLGEIGLLQIDAEGYDAEIVKMALQLPRPPKAINFETIHTPHGRLMDLFHLLQDNAYSLVYDDGNALAISRALEREFTPADVSQPPERPA